jgi:hypothetical protein
MRCLSLTVLLAVVVVASPLLAADRLTDRDVAALVARIEQGRDRFDDALDDRLKHSILREPAGEVNVDRFLNDFQESIDRLEERLKPDYAGSAEAGALLREASTIDRFLRQQPGGTKGESEWNRLATDLKTLAAAYGTEFPMPEGATVRRVGDSEVAAAADEIARSAERLKKSLDRELKNDTTFEKSEREAIVRDADQFSNDAKRLRDRVKDGKPSSAEADQVMTRAAKLRVFIESHQVPTSSDAWAAISERLRSLTSAYGASQPVSR